MRMLAYVHDKRGADGFHLITSVFSCRFCWEPEGDHGFHKPGLCHVVHSPGWLRFQWRCISASLDAFRGVCCLFDGLVSLGWSIVHTTPVNSHFGHTTDQCVISPSAC